MAPTLTFLGTGSAFTTDPNDFQSNLLLEVGDRRLLLDCGGDARRSLAARGLRAADLDAVYISHLHADHVGGLEWLGFSTHFDPSCDRPLLYCPEPLVEPLWTQVLSGGMRHIVGREATLSTYFDVRPVPTQAGFRFESVELRLVPTTHVRAAASTVESFGLFLTGPRRSIYLTTDTVAGRRSEHDDADVVLHDCETSPFATGVHPAYAELVATLPPEVRAKTWLYGYQPGAKPDARADGFLGFATPGVNVTL